METLRKAPALTRELTRDILEARLDALCLAHRILGRGGNGAPR